MAEMSPEFYSDLPPEVTSRPYPLIGISGLDTLNNAVHKSIWETFNTNRRSERAPLLLKIIGNAHEFPVAKPKRSSYDWYSPKGILKRNWIQKHLFEIPALIVVFYDLEWNDPSWDEKRLECASRVRSLRAVLENHNTKLALVLVQNSQSLGAEEAVSSDRAVALCASCELNAASLFVLPLGDHLQGYVTRLENAFYEFAQNYYHNEIKTVKGHKDHLNKNTHQYLFVRYQFKMGLLCELKQDNHTAHKHYGHAYTNLLEIRIVDTNALEIRTVAGFINYKLCRLLFALNLPRDAISQFKLHMDKFKTRIGFQQLAFEHYAWLSKQFAVFGDIFDEAVKLGLPAVQTQHPGIYYQQAAQYAILRKRSCEELCSNVIAYPQPDPLDHSHLPEFYGQRPWKSLGKMSGEPPDPQIELNGIQALQFQEKQFQHSNAIVSLFGLAIAQYKTYRCPRTRRHLILQMADEYYNSHDFGKALTLYTHMLADFRTENWITLLSDILNKAVCCAYLTANAEDYIALSFEILGGNNTLLSLDEKKKIHENLHRILNKQIPFGDVKLTPDVLQNSVIQWQPVFSGGDALHFNIEVLPNMHTCIETKARFTQKEYQVDQDISVEIFIRCTSPLALVFTQISVMVNTPSFTKEFAVNSQQLHFQPDEMKTFLVEFKPSFEDVDREIYISNIHLVMGDPKKCTFNLKFPPQDLSNRCVELMHFKSYGAKYDFDCILPKTSAKITPRHSKINVNVTNEAPALLGEWFRTSVCVENLEEGDLRDLKIEIGLVGEEAINTAEFSTSPDLSEKLPMRLQSSDTLQQSQTVTSDFYFRSTSLDQTTIELKITYFLHDPVISIKRQLIVIPVVKPFDIETHFLSTRMAPISKFYVGEELCVMPVISAQSGHSIEIESTRMELVTPFTLIDATNTLSKQQLRPGESASELFLAVCDKSTDLSMHLGLYVIKWSRSTERKNSTTTQLAINGCPVEWVPLRLTLSMPAHGVVRTPLLIVYELLNRSNQLIQLDVAMEANEAFMYSGYKQFAVSIQPNTVQSLEYNLYPLIAGSVALPKLVLTLPKHYGEGTPALRNEHLIQLLERSIPTHIYVMPQVKGGTEGKAD